MSKLKVKIDGEYHDLCDVVDKPMVYFEQEEISKIKILTDIRDYLVERKSKFEGASYHLDKVIFYHYAQLLSDLTEYAEKVGVEL